MQLKLTGRYAYNLTGIDRASGRQVNSGAQTLHVDTDTAINDDHSADDGNGNALGSSLRATLAQQAATVHRPPARRGQTGA